MSEREVKAIRAELTAQRRVYKEVESRRNALMNRMYIEGKTVSQLVELFGMREFNVIASVKALNKGVLPRQDIPGLNLSL